MASKCILNPRAGDQKTWCSRPSDEPSSTTNSQESFPTIEAAVARSEGEVCLKCAAAVSQALLRRSDPAIEMDVNEEWFMEIAMHAQKLNRWR